ncbi:MAG: histidine kinase dimerization/phospho-acceptor domain-containing protein, partial [Candidatus Methanoperedens sp.]
MLKKSQNSRKQDFKSADARVLGEILAAQNILFVLPNTTRIAEFFAHAMVSVPGVLSCHVCFGDISVHAGEPAGNVCREDCEAPRKELRDTIFMPSGFKCRLSQQPDISIIAVKTYEHTFGFFVFRIDTRGVFDSYMPFINNLANYVALTLENRLQKSLLQKAHDELERRVEERTAELITANELLQKDITERRRTEEAFRLAKEEAERANMAKTNFLHTMSHELRTPLNAILGFSELLKGKTMGELNEKQEHFIDNIQTGGNNLH